jgi:hypothetical protein
VVLYANLCGTYCRYSYINKGLTLNCLLVYNPQKHVKQFVSNTAVVKYIATKLRPLDNPLLKDIKPYYCTTCPKACLTDI